MVRSGNGGQIRTSQRGKRTAATYTSSEPRQPWELYDNLHGAHKAHDTAVEPATTGK